MHLHAPAPIVALTICEVSGEHTAFITVFANQAAGVVPFAVAVLHPFFPCVGAFLLLCHFGRHTAVGRVHQHGSVWDIYFHVQRAGEQLAVNIHCRWSESLIGECRGGVARTRSGVGGPAPFIAAVARAGVGGAAHGLRIGHAGDQIPLRIAQVYRASVTIQMEWSLIRFDVVRTQPHHFVAMGRHAAHLGRHLPELQILTVVAQIHAGKFNGGFCWIV